MTLEENLKILTEAYGPSGEEEEVRDLIKELAGKRADHLLEDPQGNLCLIIPGDGPKIMVAAHMDEIGVIVTDHDDRGFLRIAPIGGISPRYLVGQRLRFKSGLIGTVYHEKLKNWNELDWPKIYLDLGFKSGDQARSAVRIGDLACLAQSFINHSGQRLIAKAMDNRAGCAVLLELIKRLPEQLPQKTCFLFTVQEELGLRGAKTAAYRFEPDYGLAVDVTLVGDTPEAPTMAVSLGKGPAIKVKDNSLLCHPLVRDLLIDTAAELQISYQLEVLTRGGTDAGAIHLSRAGVPSGAVSIPCRYVHTPSEMIDYGDLLAAVDLLEGALLKTWPQKEESNW